MEFLSSWNRVLEVLVTTVAAYAGLVVILRVSGKRTLAKMNAFDFVVTVALGSTLATTILSDDITWLLGMTALGSLVILQFVVSWIGFRWSWFRALVTARPTLVVYRGELVKDAARKERVTRDEILEAVRSQGLARIDEAHAVVLETTGELTVLRSRERPEDFATLETTDNLDQIRDASS